MLTTHTQRLVRKQLRMNKSHKSEINPPELLGSAVCEHERANPTVAAPRLSDSRIGSSSIRSM